MKKIYYILIILTLAQTSCVTDKRDANIEDIDIEIKIERFDSAFWSLDTNNIELSLKKLCKEYPEIAPIYSEYVILLGNIDSTTTYTNYIKFRNDTAVEKLYSDALRKYNDAGDLEKELTQAFRRAKYFLPQTETPHIYFHISGLNQSIIVGEGFVSISTDNYLGENYDLYKKIGIYSYLLPNMSSKKIASDCMTAWLTSETYNIGNANLMNDIIYYGKILYTVSQLLPETSENIIMGYTNEEWEWVEKHESEMWHQLVASKDLYTNNINTKSKYTDDGPFTQPFTQKSPGRAGTYLGWQIVKSYMRNNQEISINQLLHNTDAQTILNTSNYQP